MGLKNNAEGYIEIPQFRPGYLCFMFYYMMYGSGMGQLKVFAEVDSTYEEMWGVTGKLCLSTQCPHCLSMSHLLIYLRDRLGNQGREWRLAELSLPRDAMKIKVVGVRGSNSNSDIALDNLKLMERSCKGNQNFLKGML